MEAGAVFGCWVAFVSHSSFISELCKILIIIVRSVIKNKELAKSVARNPPHLPPPYKESWSSRGSTVRSVLAARLLVEVTKSASGKWTMSIIVLLPNLLATAVKLENWLGGPTHTKGRAPYKSSSLSHYCRVLTHGGGFAWNPLVPPYSFKALQAL